MVAWQSWIGMFWEWGAQKRASVPSTRTGIQTNQRIKESCQGHLPNASVLTLGRQRFCWYSHHSEVDQLQHELQHTPSNVSVFSRHTSFPAKNRSNFSSNCFRQAGLLKAGRHLCFTAQLKTRVAQGELNQADVASRSLTESKCGSSIPAMNKLTELTPSLTLYLLCFKRSATAARTCCPVCPRLNHCHAAAIDSR